MAIWQYVFMVSDMLVRSPCLFYMVLSRCGGFKYFLFSPLFGEDSHFD